MTLPNQYQHIEEQIAWLNAIAVDWEGSVAAQIADTMTDMLAVVVHAKRHRSDPSWQQHGINLDEALARLESNDP